jgi:hypothetical protein
VRQFIGKLGLWVRNLEGKGLDSFLVCRILWRKPVWEQVTLELVTESKITWLISSSGLESFPEVLSDKYKWISDRFDAGLPQNYDFSLGEDN